MITGDIKGLISIKIKSRHDSYTDQFSRIFLMKILLVSSMIMGLNWFKDSITCIVPDSAGISAGFVGSACWIQGVYVYKELRGRSDDTGYYGIPKDIRFDGVYNTGVLCKASDIGAKTNQYCRPLEKTFFLQYQWMPFFVATLAVFYYLPYLMFRAGNTDMISLRGSLKSSDVDAEKIVKTYFNHSLNPVRTMRLRVFFNIVIKIIYIAVNAGAFFATDSVLDNQFRSYGVKWANWAKLNNTVAFDYMGMRDHPKPGNELLPPFGFCEVYDAFADVKFHTVNKHKFVCELSQNVLYQYCLIVIWFLNVIGIVLSIVGLIMQLLDHAITILCIFKQGSTSRKMYSVLTLRECEYLEFIRRRNIPLYGEVIQHLKMERFGGTKQNGHRTQFNHNLPPPFCPSESGSDVLADTDI